MASTMDVTGWFGEGATGPAWSRWDERPLMNGRKMSG